MAHLLLELHVRLKRIAQVDGGTFSTPLTQELIADALGLTTIHTNRMMRLLCEQGLITVERKKFTILDFDRLARTCDFDPTYLGERADVSFISDAALPHP